MLPEKMKTALACITNIRTSPTCLANIETGEKFNLNGIKAVEVDVIPPPEVSTNEKDNKKIVYHFNQERWNTPITITLENAFLDLSKLFTNNWLRMHGKKPLPYRKLFKYNKHYALAIYNKQRKYVRDKYTFEEWKRKNDVPEFSSEKEK